MTIGEASNKYDIRMKYLKRRLNLPETIPDDAKLRALKDEYNFSMSDVEKIIQEYK